MSQKKHKRERKLIKEAFDKALRPIPESKDELAALIAKHPLLILLGGENE